MEDLKAQEIQYYLNYTHIGNSFMETLAEPTQALDEQIFLHTKGGGTKKEKIDTAKEKSFDESIDEIIEELKRSDTQINLVKYFENMLIKALKPYFTNVKAKLKRRVIIRKREEFDLRDILFLLGKDDGVTFRIKAKYGCVTKFFPVVEIQEIRCIEGTKTD